MAEEDKKNKEFLPYRIFSPVDPVWQGIAYRDLAKPRHIPESALGDLPDSITYVTTLGIGTSEPDGAKLHSMANDEAQLRLSFDADSYTNFTTNTSGQLIIEPTGERVGINCTDPFRALEVRDDSLPQLVLSADSDNAITFQGSGQGLVVNGYTSSGSGETNFYNFRGDCQGETVELSVYNTRSTAFANSAKVLAQVASGSTGDAYFQVYDGTTYWTHGLDNSDSDAYVWSQNAALGTTNRMRLDTSGNLFLPIYTAGSVLYIGTSGQVSQNNAAFFWDNTNNALTVGAATNIIRTAAAAETVFNESGINLDFRVESDTKTHMFFIDASDNVVGINTSSPVTAENNVLTLKAKESMATLTDDDFAVFHTDEGVSPTGALQLSLIYHGDPTAGNRYVGIQSAFLASSYTIMYINPAGGPVKACVPGQYFGIGLTQFATPSASLDIADDGSGVKITRSTVSYNAGFLSTGSAFSGTESSHPWSLRTNATNRLTLSATGGATFNEDGNDYDFVAEGDTATNLFHLDASLDAVLIGTTASGDIADFRSSAIVLNEAGADRDFRVEGDNETHAIFLDASTDRLGLFYDTPDVAGWGQRSVITFSHSGGVGPAFEFNQETDASGGFGGILTFTNSAATSGRKECVSMYVVADAGGTATNRGYSLQFYTKPDAAVIAERMRITSAGALRCFGEVEIDGALNHDGASVGFFGATPTTQPTYTISNVTTDRSYDADATTLAEVADALGTLVADLRAYGLVL